MKQKKKQVYSLAQRAARIKKILKCSVQEALHLALETTVLKEKPVQEKKKRLRKCFICNKMESAGAKKMCSYYKGKRKKIRITRKKFLCWACFDLVTKIRVIRKYNKNGGKR